MDDHVLLISNDPALGRTIRAALADIRDIPFEVSSVSRLSAGLERLGGDGIGMVLLDLFLPDSRGIETFDVLHLLAPHVPILILSDPSNESVARLAVQRGAQDYLLKNHIDNRWLPRALRYVIGRKAAEEALFVEKERAQVTLDSIGDAVLSSDLGGRITYLNPVAEQLTGWSRDDAIGRPLAEVFHTIDGDTGNPIRDPSAMALQQNRAVGLMANSVLVRRDGSELVIEDSAAPIHDRRGRMVGAVVVFHDVTATRAMTLRMSHLAQHDYLTDLPNRLLLNDRVTQAISLARRRGNQAAVLFLDLDRFKHINDSLGHAIGDELLKSVAQRLLSCVRSSDTVSRQGGDEFVILLPEVERVDDAGTRARKMRSAMLAPHHISDHRLHVTASIGISLYPDDGEDAETLIKNADAAMYHVKDSGRNNYQFFKLDMNARAVERQSLEDSLRDALERREFVLHYQPKIDLETGAITSAEALIRWQHPQRGLILPAHFIPIAEDSGLIVQMGRWTLREACRQARTWFDGGRPTPVAVNISAVEIRDKHFLKNVRTILRETGLDPRLLEIELTESVLIQNSTSTAAVLRSLKTLGVQLAIDDFGTGYSSLSYLRQFPIDVLKIDQSFVHYITADSDDATLVSAMIAMCQGLKRRVIAEGVETRAQLAFLQAQRCDEAQGFYFSHPVAAEQFTKLLRTGIFKRRPKLIAELFANGNGAGHASAN